MRKTIFMVTALLCLTIMFSTTGCIFDDEEKDIQLGKMEEQIKSLRVENARLKKEIVKTDIIDTGSGYTFISLTGALIIINNLIWWVICRRRNDETNFYQ